MMQKVNISELAVAGLGLVQDPSNAVRINHEANCAACGVSLTGDAFRYKASKTFNDHQMLADCSSDYICLACKTLLSSNEATNAAASGVVHGDGFSKLHSNIERLSFLMAPPKPPFSAAIINAKRQHVWWMAKVCYDADLIPIQFGHRRFLIDRLRSIEAARVIVDYEAFAQKRDKKATFVFLKIDRELKKPGDGAMTYRFMQDESAEAIKVRDFVRNLSLGDLWAALQIRAAIRELRASSPETALAALNDNI